MVLFRLIFGTQTQYSTLFAPILCHQILSLKLPGLKSTMSGSRNHQGSFFVILCFPEVIINEFSFANSLVILTNPEAEIT